MIKINNPISVICDKKKTYFYKQVHNLDYLVINCYYYNPDINLLIVNTETGNLEDILILYDQFQQYQYPKMEHEYYNKETVAIYPDTEFVVTEILLTNKMIPLKKMDYYELLKYNGQCYSEKDGTIYLKNTDPENAIIGGYTIK